VLKRKRLLLLALGLPALAASARAQTFGLGASLGLPNDATHVLHLNNFNHSEVTAWLEYSIEDQALLRLTYGNMRTQQSSGASVTVPGSAGSGDPVTRQLKERIEYGTVGASYLFWEGFFTSGVFAGIGGYHIRPDAVPADFLGQRDHTETAFGWHGGVEGEFRLYKPLALVIRLTYHNIAAHPHRQFVNANAGLVARF
jgi:hypothetical protein